MTGKIPSGIFSTGLIDNVFNTHRDKTTGAILDRLVDLVSTDGGILIDSTAETDLQVVDAGGGVVNIKAGTAYDKFGQRINIAADDAASGLYVGTVDLSSPSDLSSDKNVKIDVDDAGAVQIDCSGATPASTTIAEIVAAINAAGFGTIAFRSDAAGNPVTDGDYITVKSSTTGGSSEIEFVAPGSADATNAIFGLDEGSYSHTYNGGGGYAITDDSDAYDVIIEYLNVESVVGNFEGGYPTGSDPEYTQRDDSYKISIQLSDVGPISDSNQHEMLLAQVSNTGGTLTLTDKRDLIMLRLKGQRQVDTTPPPAPVKVSLTVEDIPGTGVGPLPTDGYIIPRWEAVTDPSGIREYIIKLILVERVGTEVQNADPVDHTLQSFVTSASELQMKIPLPLGDKYDVYVAAKDNSLSQNISAFTSMGNIQVGGTDSSANIIMPAITFDPIIGGVRVDWPDLTDAVKQYEYCYSIDGGIPTWTGSTAYTTPNSEFTVIAPPGSTVRVRVRVRLMNLALSDEMQGQAIAGGVILGANEKTLDRQGLSVIATDDGKAARALGTVFLPGAATIIKLAVDVASLTLNSSVRGLVRIYRINEESQAVYITFETTGQKEQEVSANFTPGWVQIDAWDNQETGGSQAAFVADLVIVYVEN